MEIDGARRLLSLSTPLEADALSPISFRADEELGAPFVVLVEAVSPRNLIEHDTLLYKPACLSIRYADLQRYFNGMIRSVVASGTPQRGMWHYTLSIVPSLWFMQQIVDCRIFQALSVADIVKMLCKEANQKVSTKIYGSQPKLDYVTQYNETNLNFLTRQLEEAGLYYFFEHTEQDHTLIVTDQNQGFPAAPKPTLAVVHAGDNVDVLSSWRQVRATTFGQVGFADYDPQQPSNLPSGTCQTTLAAAGASMRTMSRWPALSMDSAVVSGRAKATIEAAEVDVSLTEAAGSNPLMKPGGRMMLERDPFSRAQGVEYVVRTVSHEGTDESWVASNSGGRPRYRNTLSLFPARVPWRQLRVTPRPQMAGIFAAIVLGNDGEEVHADALGRIKVRLMWDHRKETTAEQAVWVRVIQPWAGGSWGWQHLPRVGTEVAIAFMDGDPDRPVAVGGFYNAAMPLPFAVPAEQSKSGFRSRSTRQGGSGNFSEFSIDDEKGSELVFLHAERDMTREVEHDDKLTVNNSQTITVQAGRTATVKSGGDALTVQNGDLTVKVDSGAVSIEAAVSITLKVGDNTIVIDQGGIAIKGMMIRSEGQALVQTKGPMIVTDASGMLTLKGGLVMVN